MIRKNLLWVAEQHGHSPAVMLKAYAKWLKGATEKDIDAIRAAMGDRAKGVISLNSVGNVLTVDAVYRQPVSA